MGGVIVAEKPVRTMAGGMLDALYYLIPAGPGHISVGTDI
jgi:hypothetical protein